MALMGKKLTAAQALEGSLSSDGLVAMAGEDANVEIALARSLVHHLDEGDARRLWGKVFIPRESDLTDTVLSEEAPIHESLLSTVIHPDQLIWPESFALVPRITPKPRQGRRNRDTNNSSQNWLF